MRERKTRDVWIIESNYGYGWEDEFETDSYDVAIENYRLYIENVVRYGLGHVRLKKKRRKIVKPSDCVRR